MACRRRNVVPGKEATDVNGERWEYGSEFHLPLLDEMPRKSVVPGNAVLYAAGRDALLAVLELGRERRGWRRWYVPTYFCPEVVSAIVASGIEVLRYEDSPCWPAPPHPQVAFQPGDVLLLVNYFGLRNQQAMEAIDLGPAELVEDHTHDPWSDWAQDSMAAYCIASLRKTLPVPDGAVLWSPCGAPLPEAARTTSVRTEAALKKLAAMCLKRLYLEGQFDDKLLFRRLQTEGEAGFSGGNASGLSPWAAQLVSRLPWESYRRRRARNHAYLCHALADLDVAEILNGAPQGSCPFGVVLKFLSPEARNAMRSKLIASDIYPVIHWPIQSDGSDGMEAASALSQRLLSLPCDFRYQPSDLSRVVQAVRQSIGCITKGRP
jgi:hypothetical protein